MLLALAFCGVQWPAVVGALTGAHYGLVLVALGTVAATTLAKTARWRALFYPRHRQPRYTRLLAMLLIGQMVNIVVPARLGELARAYFLGEAEERSRAFTLGTIAVEKLVDVLMLVFLLALLVPLMTVPEWLQEPEREISITAVFLLAAVLILAYGQGGILLGLKRLLGRLPNRVQNRLFPEVEMALGSLDVLRHWDVNLQVWGWSALIWFLAATTNYVTFLAMDIDLPFSAAAFLVVVLHIGIAVPSTPGKIGVFHYLCRLGLSVFAVDRSVALGYSLVLYFVVFAPPALCGAFLLWRVTGEQSTSPCGAP